MSRELGDNTSLRQKSLDFIFDTDDWLSCLYPVVNHLPTILNARVDEKITDSITDEDPGRE